MRMRMILPLVLGLGLEAAAAEGLRIELRPVSLESDSHFDSRPSFSAAPKSEGLPEGVVIPGLEAPQASYFRARLRGIEEKISWVWRTTPDSRDSWIVVQKDDQISLSPLAMEWTESLGQPSWTVRQDMQLTSEQGDRVSVSYEFGMLPERPTVYFRILDARKGQADFGGRQLTAGLTRSPIAGTFGLGAGTRLLLDLDEDGKFAGSTTLDEQGRLRTSEGFPLNQPFLIEGKRYQATAVSANGAWIELAPTEVRQAMAQGFEMPALEVSMLDQSRLSLSEFRGKVVVLNWWFTTCPPCVVEMPGLNQLVERYSGRDDIVFLAIANNDKATLEAFLQNKDFAYRQALADQKAIDLLGMGFPRHVVINRDGSIALDQRGGSKTVHEILGAVLDQIIDTGD